MHTSELKQVFSYKEKHYFSDDNYIIAVKNEDAPHQNIIPFFNKRNNELLSTDDPDISELFVPRKKDEQDDFSLQQLIKIDQFYIRPNIHHTLENNLPKTSIGPQALNAVMDEDEIYEFFHGSFDPSKKQVTFQEECLDSLISDVYLATDMPFFVIETLENTQGSILGPFVISKKTVEGYIVKDAELSSFKTGKYWINDDSYIEFVANSINRYLHIVGIHEIQLDQFLDIKSDTELISEFEIFLKSFDNSADRIKDAISLVKNTLNADDISLFKGNKERLENLLENTISIGETSSDLLNVLPKNDSIKESKKDLEKEIGELNKRISQLNKKSTDLNDEILNKRTQIEELRQEIHDQEAFKSKILTSLEENKSKKIDELESRKSELEAIVGVLSKKEDLKRLQYRQEDLDDKIEELEKKSKLLQDSNEKLELEIRQKASDEHVRLVEFFKHFNYTKLLQENKEISLNQIDSSNQEDFTIHNGIQNYKELRDSFIDILTKNGRKFDSDFIDNLLITIVQNPLTFFAGMPGTGKTTLSRIITKSLAPSSRIAEVAVGKGWTSQSDLLGIYNPILDKFQPSNTELYSIMKVIDKEVTQKIYLNSPLAFVILDEANLSSIECYWSDFLRFTDEELTDGNFNSLSLSASEKLSFPNNLRFLATINQDHTTEMLSPRILGRANIIQMPEVDQDLMFELTNSEVETIQLSLKKCIEIFKLTNSGSHNDYSITEESHSLLKSILPKFEKLGIPVSYRQKKAIVKYCSVAEEYMRELTSPVDFCIAQRILPQINCQGSRSQKILNELKDEFERSGLKRSYLIIDRILKKGDDDSFFGGTYNYFLISSYA